MSAISNTGNVAHLDDAELELVSGGATLTEVQSPLQKATEGLSAIYQANHPIQLGPFPTPHVAVPH
jgi:hypothetical protein